MKDTVFATMSVMQPNVDCESGQPFLLEFGGLPDTAHHLSLEDLGFSYEITQPIMSVALLEFACGVQAV